MLDEIAYRGPGFRQGRTIRLADGLPWVFPPPPERPDPRHDALVAAADEAEDRAERHLAELALAMNLLARNYDLGPAQYRALFGFRPGGPELERAREEFHALAREHAPAASPAPPSRAGSGRGRGLLRVGLARVGAWF